MDFFGERGHGGYAHKSDKTPSYDTKMPLKVVFDKTAFVKFKVSNNFHQIIDKHIQNNQKFLGKFIPAYGF
jgi:hypothetical protein